MQYYYNSTDLEKVITHIRVGHVSSGKKHGSGFFIDSNLILTAAHVLKDQNGQINRNYNEYQINSTAIEQINVEDIFDTPNCDIAIIKITQKIPGELVLANYCLDLEKGDQFDSFGYRDINTDDYVPLTGSFQLKFGSHNSKKWYFTSDTIRDTNSGFSGAPILVENKLIGYWIQEINSNGLTQDLYAKLFQDEKIIEFLNDENLSHLIHKKFISKQEREYLNKNSDFKLGFSDTEKIQYQKTYAYWNTVGREKKDYPELIENLIEEYFSKHGINKKENILFVIADYGMGKSSFMKFYASDMATKFLNNEQEYFPFYFNLKNLSNFKDVKNNSMQSSVIEETFRDKEGINVTEETYKDRKIIFIIDSLDESGELNINAIKLVIKDIFQIAVNRSPYPGQYRFLVASRPIPNVIDTLIIDYSKKIVSENERQYFQYLSVYGFNPFENQFNNYIEFAIKENIKSDDYNDLIIKILDGRINLYNELSTHFKNYELERPIYAFLIYQLIKSKKDVTKMKIEDLYFEFINQLTTRANYLNEAKPSDEYLNRYILHVIAALRSLKIFYGNRLVNLEKDFDLLYNKRKYPLLLDKSQNIVFKSLAYLSSKSDELGFHHDSIAEFLTAEYFFKIFLYNAFENNDIGKLREEIQLGNPTPETMDFLNVIIQQIIFSINGRAEEKLQARINLFPLLCSMSLKSKVGSHKDESDKYEIITKTYSKKINADWYQKYLNNKSISREEIEHICNQPDWPITEEILNRIILLSKEIINSEDSFMLQREFKFEEKRINFSKKIYNESVDIDKWIALFVGKNIAEKLNLDFYDEKLSSNVAKMMRNWSEYDGKCSPSWAWQAKLFTRMKLIGTFDTPIKLSNIIFASEHNSDYYYKSVEFSDSTFHFVDFSYARLDGVKFTNCKFDSVNFFRASICKTDFSDIQIEYTDGIGLIFTNSFITRFIVMPNIISDLFINRNRHWDKPNIPFSEILHTKERGIRSVEIFDQGEAYICRETILSLINYAINNFKVTQKDENSLKFFIKYFDRKKTIAPFYEEIQKMFEEVKIINSNESNIHET